MKIQNMTSSRGNKVANQFIIYNDDGVFLNQSDEDIEDVKASNKLSQLLKQTFYRKSKSYCAAVTKSNES